MSSDLRNKLFHYEVPPPAKVWEEIADALESDVNDSVSTRLYQFEQNPPARAWEKIAGELNSDKKPVSQIPFYKRYSRPLKYAGAVAALFFLAVLVSLLITKKTESEVPLQSQTAKPGAIQTQDTGTATDTQTENRNSAALAIKSKPRTTRSTGNAASPASEPLSMLSISERVDRLFPKQAHRTHHLPDSELSDRYMVISDDEGNAVRLPRKMYDSIACPSDDITCKQRVKNLQRQIASAALTADFTGVLEILNNIKDKK